LLARAASGDADARGQLYRRHAPRFLAFLLRLCGNAQDAEDLAHDAFLVAFAKLDRIQPGRFRSFLYGIGVRKSQHLFRRRALLRRLGFISSADRPDVGEIEGAGATAEELADLVRVLTLVRRLPALDRVAWTLRRVEGFTVDEVAELADCSPATVKRRVERVERHLADELKERQDAR
jgi:RNA polymerase sigma-70 factor (ECF subfamily)